MHRLIAHSLAATTLAAFFSNPALADAAESRRNCESLALLNAPAFEVETAEWVAASAAKRARVRRARRRPLTACFAS